MTVITHITALVVIFIVMYALAHFLRRSQQLRSVPNPYPGQVWLCMNNMKRYRVSSVTTMPSGAVLVDMADEYANGPAGFGIGVQYATGIDEWRRRIVDEDMQYLCTDTRYL